jgi:hypothetical protein
VEERNPVDAELDLALDPDYLTDADLDEAYQDVCDCEEDNICPSCHSRAERQAVQSAAHPVAATVAGFIAARLGQVMRESGMIQQEDGTPLMRLGTADPRDGDMDTLLIDAAIHDRLAWRTRIQRRPAMREQSSARKPIRSAHTAERPKASRQTTKGN